MDSENDVLGDWHCEWYESENVIRHAFLESKIYQLISNFFSDVDHTHSTWNSMTLSPYATLYVNEALHLCRLHFDRTFNGASADTFYTWSDETVPTTYIPEIYRPSVQSHGSINQAGVLYVGADGSYGGKFAVGWSNSARHCIGDCWWNYNVISTE